MTLLNLAKIMLLTGLALILIWLVMTRSFVAHFAKTSPQTALSLRSNDAKALIKVLDNRLNKRKKGEKEHKKINIQQFESQIKKVLLESPLNARALRILGQISEKENNLDLAQQSMEMAMKLSIREPLAAYWLMQQAYQKKDYKRSLHYAKILLWHRPKLVKNIIPILASIAQNKEEREHLEVILAQNPRWRSRFFRTLQSAITDARTPLNLFLSLKKSAYPPTDYELKNYLNFLNSKKMYNLSYYSWLQFLPPQHLAKTGFLFNGDFSMPLNNMPFNWVIGKGKGATADIVFHPDDRQKRALNIRLSRGQSNLGRISQIIMLGAGSYTFKGRHKGALVGQRGLRWRITCLGQKRTKISETDMFIGRKRNWREFKVNFTVPNNCPAQLVNLILDARTRSEKLASGKVWYADLKIIPTRLQSQNMDYAQ